MIQLFYTITIRIIFFPFFIVICSKIQKSNICVQGDQCDDAFLDQGKSKIELQISYKDVNP